MGAEGKNEGSWQSWSQSNPDCLEPTAIEVAVWLPGLVAAEVVGHIFIYGLVAVPFVYSISQRYLAQAYYSWKGCHTPPAYSAPPSPSPFSLGFSPCGHCHVPRHPGQTLGVFFLSFLLPNSTATTQTICLPSSNMSGVHLFLRLHCHAML